MNDETRQFIFLHRDDDVRQLALLTSRHPNVEMPFALDQIRGWQTARTKLPSWANVKGIVYPPHLSMEQCSSEATALYKAQLAGRGRRYVDLTGGFGVDFSFMSRSFEERVYVEQNERLCDLAKENFPLLHLEADVVHDDSVEFLRVMDEADVVFMDPARRDAMGNRTYGIADCTPNVLALAPLLQQKAKRVILKLSPMLDWHKGVEDLRGAFIKCQPSGSRLLLPTEVHIVSVGNECKELLIVMEQEEEERPLRLFCVNDHQRFCCEASSDTTVTVVTPLAGQYLYVPNASVMKAGCFGAVCSQFGVGLLGANSHLFCSEKPLLDAFPGRCFEILDVSTMNKKELRKSLSGISQANISVRNFPLSVMELRKKLKLREGGDTYIFATTTAQRSHVLLICKRMA